MRQKAVPVGVENFEKIITDYYYVDKTPFIQGLIDHKGEVNLFTRPRRFGKSLNISMFQHFFDITLQDKKHLFDGLKISKTGPEYLKHQNAYPLINMTFKDVAGLNFAEAFREFQTIVLAEYDRHSYLLESPHLKEDEKALYGVLLAENMVRALNPDEVPPYVEKMKKLLSDGLFFLCKMLHKHYRQKVVILIDEYDVPLENAHFKSYYDDMLPFLRGFLLKALKTNPSLEFAVMTGCLRISKESIFTGLNNLNVYGINTEGYDEYFGFTVQEVRQILAYYNMTDKEAEAKEWYNGYLFGNTVVYNPWSIIRYVSDVRMARLKNTDTYPRSHWSNTSSNTIIKTLIHLADQQAKTEIENLIQGQSITKPIKEDIVYGEIQQSMDNLWNFLYFTGYLKKVSASLQQETIYMELQIPNLEIKKIYKDKILDWFQEQKKSFPLEKLHTAVQEGNPEQMQEILIDMLQATISYLDAAENFYHGFLVGVLGGIKGYVVKSNREQGHGRSDIYLEPLSRRNTAIIIELKIAKSIRDLEAKCDEAIQQINEKHYDAELLERGYLNIAKYGIAFFGKDCEVKKETP